MAFVKKYIECKKCIMNSGITSYFSIDEEGICNYCRDYESYVQSLTDEHKKYELQKVLNKIRSHNSNKKYNCILGISGGKDSSFLAWWAKKEGLRPLLVHLDNGWNSELAVQNIEKVCKYCDFDLYTHVVDWEEFRELQKAYFRAHVVDIEALTDHAIYALVLKLAKKHNIRYVLSGNNYSTEFIMPKDWVHSKSDSVNILDIISKNSNVKIRTYPCISFIQNLYFVLFHKLEYLSPLNYLDYTQNEIKDILQNEMGWQPYGFKHGESLFTLFYQNYILPKKFKIDKRYAHYSTLINSGQMTRKEALLKLQIPLYEDEKLKNDLFFFLKKMNMTEDEFMNYINHPPVPHSDYKTDEKLWKLYFRLIKLIKR